MKPGDDERAYRGRGRPVMGGFNGEGPRLPKITARSVTIFERLIAVGDDDAEGWWDAQCDLMDALKLPIWCFPPVLPPVAEIAFASPDAWTPVAKALWLRLEEPGIGRDLPPWLDIVAPLCRVIYYGDRT